MKAFVFLSGMPGINIGFHDNVGMHNIKAWVETTHLVSAGKPLGEHLTALLFVVTLMRVMGV